MNRRLAVWALLLAPLSLLAQEHWVATWAASPQQVRAPLAPPPAAAPAPGAPRDVGDVILAWRPGPARLPVSITRPCV